MAKKKKTPATFPPPRQPVLTPPADAGSLDLGVSNGQVIMNFGRPIPGMVFSPTQARQLGQGFIEMAMKAEMLASPQDQRLQKIKSHVQSFSSKGSV